MVEEEGGEFGLYGCFGVVFEGVFMWLCFFGLGCVCFVLVCLVLVEIFGCLLVCGLC